MKITSDDREGDKTGGFQGAEIIRVNRCVSQVKVKKLEYLDYFGSNEYWVRKSSLLTTSYNLATQTTNMKEVLLFLNDFFHFLNNLLFGTIFTFLRYLRVGKIGPEAIKVPLASSMKLVSYSYLGSFSK